MEQENVRLKKLLAETMLDKEALDHWAYEHIVQLRLIQLAKPTYNAYIESFNGKFRDGCLNEHWFHSLPHARRIIQAWRKDYNEQRPHSMLGYMTPVEAAERQRQQ
jgi:putative transposase